MMTTSMIGQVRDDVRRWQRQMVARGWHLAVDGRCEYNTSRGLRKCFGYKTAVCTAFEREKGLHVELPGIVGPQVWKASFELPTG